MKILAVDVGGTMIKSALCGEDNQLREFRETPSPGVDVSDCIRSIIAIADSYEHFDVLSVAMTGQVDKRTLKRVYEYGKETDPDPNGGIPVGEKLQEVFQCPVFVLNDSNAAALGEAWLGAGRKHKDFLCLTYGTGVGGGIVQDGSLFLGERGIAAEFGHIVIHGGGNVCNCGHHGCYEAYASTTALVRAARKVRTEITNGRQFFENVSADPELMQVALEWIQEIVEGLLTLTYIFNPSCIVLGGGVMEREDVLQWVRKSYYAQVIPSFINVEIVPAELGNMAGMYGAVNFARQCIGNN